MLPEYTMIEIDEEITDEGFDSTGAISNFDNKTGPRYGNKYVMSGHMKKMIGDVHRYLGKVVDKGKDVPLPNLCPWDSSPFKNRKTYINGKMKVLQLDDDNSEYFAVRDAEGQKVDAPLDGMQGHGEVGVKIPDFWYKGIDYLDYRNPNVSRKYMCVSYNKEKPSEKVAEDVTVLEIGKILDGEYDVVSVYREKYYLRVTNLADTVADRLNSNNNKYVLKIDVEGVKMMKLPANTDTNICSVFTDGEGNVLTGEDGMVIDYGEVEGKNVKPIINNYPVMVRVPKEAKWLFFTLDYYWYNLLASFGIEYIDIVMHRGSKYSSAEEMGVDNIDEWIADFEPRWEKNKAFFLHAADVVADDYKTMYTPFDGTKEMTRGSEEGTASLNAEGTWCPYDIFRSAYKRGLQCIDVDALYTMKYLLMMKYGRRTEYILASGSENMTYGKNGVTRKYGMQDSECRPDGSNFKENNYAYYRAKQGVSVENPEYVGDVMYERFRVNNFLGVERISEWSTCVMDRCVRVSRLNEAGWYEASHIEYIDADLNVRKELNIGENMSAKNVVWGRKCSLLPSVTGGSAVLGYDIGITHSTNYQKDFVYSNHSTAIISRGAVYNPSFIGINSTKINIFSRNTHSRLMFRGNIEEVTDIEEYLNAEEVRYPAPVPDEGIDIFA